MIPTSPARRGGRKGHADPVAGSWFLHRAEEGLRIGPFDDPMPFGQAAQERRWIESLQIVQHPMGREDRQSRVPDVDQEHEHVVEGGVGGRIRMLEPLPVAEIQRRFISMVAVGDVQP